MSWRLHIPVIGFETFALYRRAEDEEVTVSVNESTYTLDSEELLQWLLRIGWDGAPKLVDLCWSFRAITCDLKKNRYKIDDKQVHPDDLDAKDSLLDVFVSANPGMRT